MASEQEKVSVNDIIKDFKDTESINDRYLLKEKKQENIVIFII